MAETPETKAPVSAVAAPKTSSAPKPTTDKVQIVSEAEATVVVTTPAGAVTLEPGKPVEVEPSLADAVHYLPNVRVA